MTQYIKPEKVQPKNDHFGWVFVGVPESVMEVHTLVIREIDENDLYIKREEENGNWRFGIEDDPHLTVKYGFEFDDPQPIIEVLKDKSGGNVEVNGVEVFEQDEYDVLVATVKSEALNKLHKTLIEDLNILDTHPEYKPHVTIAYFKKGKAKLYERMAHKAFLYYLIDFNFNEVTFEDTKNNRTKITLK